MRARATQSPDQISSGQNVAPLIAAAHLQSAFVPVEEHEIVVCLQQWISKFGERYAVLRFQPAADRFFAEQVVDGEVFPHITQKFHHRYWSQPVLIVYDERRI